MKRGRYWARRVKHVADRIVAAALLVVLSPIMLMTALAVWAVLGRPILFRQTRPGYLGRPFTIVKFRTMSLAPPGSEDSASDGERLGRFGRFLRATSLDELPELINVVRGEMSLVGPRPLLMTYLKRYSAEQARRHEAQPGITGLAQVNGRNALGWERRFRFDLWYIDHWSLWLDCKILVLTLVQLLNPRGISAEGHATMPEFMGNDSVVPFRPLPRPPVGAMVRAPFKIAALGVGMAFSLAACVAVVDPYGVTHVASISGFNAQKTERTDGGGRIAKSLQLWLHDPQTLILGGSRTWTGIDPDDPAFAGGTAYNAAVRDATIDEVVAIGRFALVHAKPKRIFIGLEFSMFKADRADRRDFEDSGFDGDPMPVVLLRSLIGPQALKDSVQTVEHNVQGEYALDSADGYRWFPGEANYRRAFRNVLVSFLDDPGQATRVHYDRHGFVVLRQFLDQAAAAGVPVTLFTAPLHARQLETIRAVGLAPVRNRWLADLTAMVAEANAAHEDGAPIRLFNFTGYNSLTTEDIPDPGDPETVMRWYWTPSTYKPTLGHLIIARLTGTAGVPADFGIQLTPAALPGVLAAEIGGHRAYLAHHPEEVRDIATAVAAHRAKLAI